MATTKSKATLTIPQRERKANFNIYVHQDYKEALMYEAEQNECAPGDFICALYDFYIKNK